jgi:hypothetical protein
MDRARREVNPWSDASRVRVHIIYATGEVCLYAVVRRCSEAITCACPVQPVMDVGTVPQAVRLTPRRIAVAAGAAGLLGAGFSVILATAGHPPDIQEGAIATLLVVVAGAAAVLVRRPGEGLGLAQQLISQLVIDQWPALRALALRFAGHHRSLGHYVSFREPHSLRLIVRPRHLHSR